MHRTEPRVVALYRTLVVLMLFAGAVASSSSSPTVLTTSGPVVGQTIDGVDVRVSKWIFSHCRSALRNVRMRWWLTPGDCAGLPRSTICGGASTLCHRG